MNGDIVNDKQRPIFTSAGNAWVICNSQSRPGFKYYFNTFSGQSVWNLSPEEIEKAKKFTKGLPISEIEKCPEPAMDPPMDRPVIPIPPQATAPRIHNEPFVRQISNMFPPGLLNVPTIPGMSNVNGLNPCIWNNPPHNPATAPVIYVAYPQMNFQQSQEYPHNFPKHLNEEPNSYRQPYINRENDMFNRDNDRFNNRAHNMVGQNRSVQRNMQQGGNWKNKGPDLRQKLMRKRSKSMSFEFDPLWENDKEDCSNQDFHSKNISVQINTEETPSKYDLSVLEQLKTAQSKSSIWLIVADTEIILRNFSFLDKVTDPEQNCYLVVPDHVMKELQEQVLIRGDAQTRRILRFLSQQIDAELVYKGGKITNQFHDDATYKMMATCEDLAQRNNVILLSDDPRFQIHKNENSDVHILAWIELTHILEHTQTKQAPLKYKSSTFLKFQGMSVVMPKTIHQEKIVLTRRPTPNFEISPSQTKKETIQTHPVQSSSKSTIDNQNIINEIARKQTENDEVDYAPNKTSESVEITKRPKTPFGNDKRGKDIKLLRNLRCTMNTEVPQTRQYRWRTRKNSNSREKSKSSSVVSDQASIEPKQQEIVDCRTTENILRPITPEISPPQAPSISRSSVSSRKGATRPHIVIEETSTSGIISNTTLDSDSINPRVTLKKTVSACEDVDFELFEFVGQSMEEVLRTRREEWVLRFVQIMEETLKEILRADSPFQNKCYDYTPPLAADLPELARSIIKKFSDHFNVVDAANRLSFKVQKISDTEGANIEPKQYMDMYSFGVYLIRSLKNATEDCEDLISADESLKKLLHDIQNANRYGGHHDDELNESSFNATKLPNAEKELLLEFPTISDNKAHEQDNSNKNCARLLSPRKGNQEQIVEQSQNRKLPNETSFFSSLELAKITSPDKPILTFDFPSTHSTPHISKIAQTPPQLSPSPITLEHSPVKQAITNQDVSDDIRDSSKTDPNLDANRENTNKTTCFVRNFNSIPQFEEKLNKKTLHVRLLGEKLNKQAQNGRQFDENINKLQTIVTNDVALEEVYDDDYDYAEEYDEPVGEACDDELEDGEIQDDDEDLLDAPNDEDSRQQTNNEKFEWFIREFTDEIRRTIKAVLMLCTKLGVEFKKSLRPTQETQDELRTASASVYSIKTALESILDSDPTSPENNIVLLLKNANLHDYIPSKELLLEYRNIISKCRDQVNTCHEKVTQIMQVARIPQLA